MITQILSLNYTAIFAASVIFFIIGSLWYSVLFGRIWSSELSKHGTVITKPDSTIMAKKSLLTFISGFITSMAVACLVRMTDSITVQSGLHLGLLLAVGFVATTLGTHFVWSNKSLKLFLIDVGYPMIGVIVAAVLLSLWR